MTRPAIAAILAVACWCGTARVQNSTQAPAPSSSKFSGGDAAGDPSGAVRALGSGDDGDRDGGKRGSTVDVPRLGGEAAARTGGTPAGTSHR